MRKLAMAVLIVGAAYGAWIGLSQTELLPSDFKFRGIFGGSEYGGLLRGRL